MTVVPRPNTLLTPPELHPDMELVMRVMPMPKDANGNGDIFGGWIMSQVDLAGCVLPGRVSHGRVTTVAVNEFTFKNAVSIGDLLSFYARVERIGNLRREHEQLIEGERATGQTVGQRLAVEQFHRDERDAVGLADVEPNDVVIRHDGR